MLRRSLLVFTCCILAAASISAAPMTQKELEFMVRMHLPDADILRDVGQRRLLTPVNPAAEGRLTALGASADLIAKLKSGDFALPPDQAAAAMRFTQEQNARVAKEKAADAASYAALQQSRSVQNTVPVPTTPAPAAVQPEAGNTPMGHSPNIQFTAIDGRVVNLQDMKGKVVLIDFWATWCGPCVGEIPHVKAAYDKYHGNGFEVVGISLDHEKSALESFVAAKGLPWPQFFDAGKYTRQFAIRSIPTMWLVDKHGLVRDADGRTDLEGKVERLLAE